MGSERLAQRVGAVLLVSLLGSSFAPSVALAQPAAATKEAKETARALMQEGREARDDKKDLKAALEAFRKAHSIMKAPSTGLEVARTLEQMGLYVEAEGAAQEVVDLPAQPKEPPAFAQARTDAKALVDSVKAKIGFLKVVIKGANLDAVEVTIDELSVPSDSLKGPIKQNPGKHTVVARGPKTDTMTVEIVSGQTQDITLTVKAADKPKVEAPPPPVEAPPPAPAKSPFLRPLSLAGFGLAGVGLIAGGITGALTLSKGGSVKDKCVDNRCPPDTHDDLSSAKTMGTISTISFAVAGVGAVIGVVGVLTAPKAATTTGRVEISPFVGPSSAGVFGRF